MTYNPNIPQRTDLISVSQQQLLNNFSSLNTIFDDDHFTFNYGIPAERGQHRHVTFPETEMSDPTLTGVQGEIYPKTVNGAGEPFFANANSANVLWRGGTGSGLVSQTTGGNASNGLMTLPNGIIFLWAFATVTSNNSFSIIFPNAFPNNCFTVIPSIATTTGGTVSLSYSSTSISKTGFTGFLGSSQGVSSKVVAYLAIGN